MFTDQTIILLNIACCAFLTVAMAILMAATRLKNGAGYLALVTASTTVPVYLANLIRTLGSEAFETSMYAAVTLNVLCFPFLWFFVRRQLDSAFRFTPRSLLHLLPAAVSLAAALLYYGPMSPAEVAAERELLEAGSENMPAIVNDVLLFGQFFIYFPLMFRFVKRKKRHILENCSDSNYVLLRWLPRFLTLFFVLFLIVFIAYVIDPRTDAWLIPVLNTVGMVYLIYCAVVHAPATAVSRKAETCMTTERTAAPTMDMDAMRGICRRAYDYAFTTEAYLRPDISLAAFAEEAGIPQRNLSRSINAYLRRNFFEFINEMRVEEAKRRLLELDASGYSIDSIHAACGFRSRSTFFLVFKKAEGKTPAAWLREQTDRT